MLCRASLTAQIPFQIQTNALLFTPSVPPVLYAGTAQGLFREMVRVYGRYCAPRDRDEDRWIMNLIQEVKAEEQQRPTPPEELAKEEAELTAYGQRQAKKLGIRPKDISHLIHEYRVQNQSESCQEITVRI